MVDATRLGAWLQPGEGIGWLAAGTMPNSLYRMPIVYRFLACVFFYSCPFLFVVFVCLCCFFCSHWSLVDVSLIYFCPADHVPDWQPRIVLGMVEARSVYVKKKPRIVLLMSRIHTNTQNSCLAYSPCNRRNYGVTKNRPSLSLYVVL